MNRKKRGRAKKKGYLQVEIIHERIIEQENGKEKEEWNEKRIEMCTEIERMNR